MSRPRAYVVSGTLLVLAAGCAGTPEVADQAAAPSLQAAQAVATPADAAAASAATIVPDTVLDANALVARTPPRPICREMLIQGSNVREKRCMSADDWKIWDRLEAENALKMVRMLQSGQYR